MQFSILAAGAFVAAVSAAPANSARQDTTQMFEFQSFAASCSATSTDCTYSFNLNGATQCSGTQPAFVGTPGDYKKLPNIGSEVCAETTWSVTRVDSGFQVAAKNAGANGISGTYTIPSTDFAVVDGVEKYTGNGIVILYGIPTQ